MILAGICYVGITNSAGRCDMLPRGGLSTAADGQVLVDGLDVSLNVNNPSFNGVASVPSVMLCRSLKSSPTILQRSSGGSAAGSVNVIMKSGTNRLQGSAFEHLRNCKLDANDSFANRAGLKLVSCAASFSTLSTGRSSATPTALGSPTFRTANSQANSPRQIQFGLRLEF